MNEYQTVVNMVNTSSKNGKIAIARLDELERILQNWMNTTNSKISNISMETRTLAGRMDAEKDPTMPIPTKELLDELFKCAVKDLPKKKADMIEFLSEFTFAFFNEMMREKTTDDFEVLIGEEYIFNVSESLNDPTVSVQGIVIESDGVSYIIRRTSDGEERYIWARFLRSVEKPKPTKVRRTRRKMASKKNP
jgi:hypothetical protein